MLAKLTEKTLETIKTVAQNDYPGAEYVYKALKKGNSTMLEYVGITNDFARRSGEWSMVTKHHTLSERNFQNRNAEDQIG